MTDRGRRRRKTQGEPDPFDELVDVESRWEQLQIREELRQFDALAERIKVEET